MHTRIATVLQRQCGGAPIMMMETSKSWIFLTPDEVYKLKKSVRDELQDLTPLRARHDNTLTEIDLNRRLAPQVYLGAVRVVEGLDGALAIGQSGTTVDWLLHMRRLPASRMLDVMIDDHLATPEILHPLVDKLVDFLVPFYRNAPQTNLTAQELLTIFYDQQVMNRGIMLNPAFAQYQPRLKAVLHGFDQSLGAFFTLFSRRVAAGWIRECHGDLRPEHICAVDPPIVFDCLEFNRNLRIVDPLSEIAFLGLECEIQGATWIKQRLIQGVTKGLLDRADPELLRYYTVIHALLRIRLCLAHLLVPQPRKPAKWIPLSLRYLEIAEGLMA